MTQTQVYVITTRGHVIPFRFIPFRTRQEVATAIYKIVDKNQISHIQGMLEFPVTELGYPIFTKIKD